MSQEPPQWAAPWGEPGGAPAGEPGRPEAPPPGAATAGAPSGAPVDPPPGPESGFLPRPVNGLAAALLAVSGLYGLTVWAAAIVAFAAQAEFEDGALGAATVAIGAVTLVQTLAQLVAYGFASMWLMRVYQTASAVAPRLMRRSIAWTWLAWWVPFVSLWFPKQIVDDVWRVAASQPGRSPVRATGGWWFWWIAASVTSSLTSFASRSSSGTTSEVSGFAPGWRVFAALFLTGAFVMWVRVVRGVSAAHDAGPWTPYFRALPAPVSRADGVSGSQGR
ncbi:DUF4328 domain-containing protein [Kineosporia sp. R_H_3]|uniref:DUF4328 domain-containing protein n=1 Tax=Kineosporia sp. R_H_3 TaxID=1961848 RepID=UPI000B4BB501|nr:DUF4328 domain-containing protein [Kineosporia sp. R_H_3]